MLGQDLVGLLARSGREVTALGRGDLDITDAGATSAAIDKYRPSAVVNCAAWTAVDDAESHEGEALRLNGDGPGNLAAACAQAGAILVQPSTDYVFDGHATSPYAEDAPTGPRSAYGRTKLAGERAVLEALPGSGYVIRTAWLYGAHGGSFVRTMLRLARRGNPVDVVADQAGQPTWTADLAAQVIALVDAGAPAGVYHGTSSGETTWFGLAQEVFELYAATQEGAPAEAGAAGRDLVRPTTSAAYQRPAPRPAYSVLGHDAWRAAGIAPMGHWRDALHRAFPQILAANPALRGSPELARELGALVVARQQPALQGLLQRRRAGVLVRQDGGAAHLRQRPLDPERGVQRVDAVLAAGGVAGRAQVQDGRVVGQRHERVAEPLGEEQRLALGVVEPDGLRRAEGGRAHPDVHHHVEDRAAHAAHVLRLARRHVREVHAPEHAAPGYRAVDLRDLERVAEVGRELGAAEGLQEGTPVIWELARRVGPRALDLKRFHRRMLPAGHRPARPNDGEKPAGAAPPASRAGPRQRHSRDCELLGDDHDPLGLLPPVALRDLELDPLSLFKGAVTVCLDR
jgi:dTDP-4-dehydrorhamnose reductase